MYFNTGNILLDIEDKNIVVMNLALLYTVYIVYIEVCGGTVTVADPGF